MYLYAILGNKFIFVLKSGISDRTFFIRPHQIALLPPVTDTHNIPQILDKAVGGWKGKKIEITPGARKVRLSCSVLQ